jgi:hypothetical protein
MQKTEIDEFLYQALQSGLLIHDKSIPAQFSFVVDDSRAIAAWTTRRAGKTTGLAHRFLRTLLKYPNCFCPYIGLTRDSARNIMWKILQTETERFGIAATFTESNLTMTLQNGSRLQLFGADMKNFLPRLKGIKTPGAAIDEAQDFRSHIQSLIDDVLTPATLDYTDGWIAVTGTPGPVPHGFFYDITETGKHGYSIHSWSLFDNPYLPDPKAIVDDLKIKKGWLDNNPTLLREYYGKWVLDTDSLLVHYSSANNNYSSLPICNWTYLLGIDLGYNDADALAVLAWSPTQPATYLVEEVITEKQGLTELVGQIQKLNETYKFAKMVIDEGGLGKKLAEEMRRQHKVPVHPADKARKMESIAFLNDALRTKRFFAKANSRFAQDSYLVQIDKDKTTPDRIVVKDSFHSDIIDATLYAFKESPAFSYQVAAEKIVYGSKEWMDSEVKRMEDEAYERALKDAEEAKGLNQWY